MWFIISDIVVETEATAMYKLREGVSRILASANLQNQNPTSHTESEMPYETCVKISQLWSCQLIKVNDSVMKCLNLQFPHSPQIYNVHVWPP